MNHPPDPLRTLALSWIERAAAWLDPIEAEVREALATPVEIGPAIRDVRPDHFLYEGDEVSGLIDFGAMEIDSVASDLARLDSEWFDDTEDLKREGFAAYERIRPLRPAERALIPVYERSAALLGGGHWVRWHFAEGRRFDDPGAEVRGLERGLARLDRLRKSPRFDL